MMNHKDTKAQRRVASREPLFAALLCAFVSLWFITSTHAEILDRIVAAVDGHIVTLSDLQQEREIRARLGEKPIDDDKALLQELIENRLIESQMADFPGVEVTDEEVDAELKKTQARQGAASQAVREAVRKRLQMQRYFDVRFRQFLRASDEEVRKYYDEVFVPEARKRGVNPVPSFEQVADMIRMNIIEEKLDHEVMGWLEAIRRRSNIEIFE
jgi:peptidyl-prolyl cis-trans isomerase SurA